MANGPPALPRPPRLRKVKYIRHRPTSFAPTRYHRSGAGCHFTFDQAWVSILAPVNGLRRFPRFELLDFTSSGVPRIYDTYQFSQKDQTLSAHHPSGTIASNIMDLALCLSVTDSSIKADIPPPQHVFYESFLRSLSDGIIRYSQRMQQRPMCSCAICALRNSHKRTRTAIRRYQADADEARDDARRHRRPSASQRAAGK